MTNIKGEQNMKKLIFIIILSMQIVANFTNASEKVTTDLLSCDLKYLSILKPAKLGSAKAMLVYDDEIITSVIDKEFKKITATKARSKQFLEKVGICTPKGKLTKAYR
jgi:hypothetical protein